MMMRLGLFLALAALAAAKLNPCDFLPGVETGITCTGDADDTSCTTDIRIECDNMYPFVLFSPSGIPCGAASADACPDTGFPDIAFANENYPMEALDAVVEEVRDILVRGQNNTGVGGLFNLTEQKLFIEQDTKVNITFLFEGACDRNTLGMTTFQADDPNVMGDPRDITFEGRKTLLNDVLDLSVIFPNDDFEFCQCETSPGSYADFCSETDPPLTTGTTMRLIPDFRESRTQIIFEAGTFLSFFIMPDGFDLGYMPGLIYDEPAEQLLFSTPELNDPALALESGDLGDVRQHTFIFSGPPSIDAVIDGSVENFDFSEETFICFEDRRRFDPPPGKVASNNDFEDLCFFITGIVTQLPSAAPSSAPTAMICEDGIISECGNVCCAESCGTCGGCNCASNDGGAELCCPLTILFNGIPCVSSSDVGCIVDPFLICDSGSNCPA